MTVNICFAYDSLYEITEAINKIEGKVSEKNIMENLKIPQQIDLLVRTSN
jgi:undecaprenyl pyrophosphate synthase